MRISRLLVPSMAVLGPSPLQDSYPRTLFTFGDSYTSTRFNTSGTQPSIDNPMGNPSLGEGTSAGGINWVGYLTTVHNTSVVLNFNLAAYGATVNDSIVYEKKEDLVYQVSRDFRDHYCLTPGLESEPRWRPGKALFAIWIGINDIQARYMDDDFPRTVSLIIQSYFDLLDQLVDCGAVHFVVLTVPPTTRTPKMLGRTPEERGWHASAISSFNHELYLAALDWIATHPDSPISVYNAGEFMRTVLDFPEGYGFKDNTCMGQGCVWVDDFHPTSAFHDLLAADMAKFLRKRGYAV